MPSNPKNITDLKEIPEQYMTLTLGFVPADEVAQYFDIIRGEMPEELDPMVDFFETTYIRRVE